MKEIKILFALNSSSNTDMEESILSKYKKEYEASFIYKKELYMLGILKALKEEEYDVLIISDFLEKDSLIESSFIDKITDNFNRTRIIMLLDDKRKASSFVKSIFSMGCYDAIFKSDFNYNTLLPLMVNPRSKKDAKEYYAIEEINIKDNININENEIAKDELDIVLNNLNRANIDNIGELLDIAEKTYSFNQMVYLISVIKKRKDIINVVIESNYDISKYEIEPNDNTNNHSRFKPIIKEKIVEVEKEVIREVEKEVIKEVEVEKEVIKEIEKPIIIEKEIVKVNTFKYDSVITFVSAASTGKSYLSWNLAHALSKYYKVAYVNIDTYCSASDYFGINVPNMPLHNIEKKTLKDVISEGYQTNSNLVVYTGKPGETPNIRNDIFFKILNQLRSENNIVIIDTSSIYNDNLQTALNYSNDIIFVYDLDICHLKANDRLYEKVRESLSPNNTIAVINNVYSRSKELPNVDRYLRNKKVFREITSISNCGDTTYDYMYSNTCNYKKDNNDFTTDTDVLISILRLEGANNRRKDNVGIAKKLFNKFRKEK